MKTSCASLIALFSFVIGTPAQDKGPPESGVYFMPHVQYENQDAADFDDRPGDLSRTFLGGEIGWKRYMPRDSYARIYARYGEHEFDFGGGGTGLFANPFETIAEEEVGGIILNRLENGWGYYVRLGFVSMRDPDANLISSTEARAMGIVGYRLSDKLELGLGLLAKSQISQAPRAYPIPVINYDFNDRLKIVTSDQLDLQYSVVPGLTTIILTSNPKRWRARLANDNEENPGGIAEYQRVPLSLSLDQIVHKNVKVTLTGTIIPYHKLTIEDAHGDELEESELDSALQFGAQVSFRF